MLLQSFPAPADFAQFRSQELQPYDDQMSSFAKRYEALRGERDGLLKQRAFYRPDPPPGGTLKPEQQRMNPPPPELVQNLARNQMNISTQEDLFRKAMGERQARQRELERQERRLMRLWRGEAPGFPEEPDVRSANGPGDSSRAMTSAGPAH